MKIIKDFLPKKQFEYIKKTLTDPRFPYYYQKRFLKDTIKEYENLDFFFCHILFDEMDKKQNSDDIIIKEILMPLLKKLKAERIVRAKINLYTNTGKQVESTYHIDNENENVKVGIYCVNSNNGYTQFKTGEKARSLENSMILFNANELHKAVTQTDTKVRINININYS